MFIYIKAESNQVSIKSNLSFSLSIWAQVQNKHM